MGASLVSDRLPYGRSLPVALALAEVGEESGANGYDGTF